MQTQTPRADACTPAARRPAVKRARPAPMLYPDLPDTPSTSGGRVTAAEFDRAYFLRELAEFRAAERLTRQLYRGRKPADRPTCMFMLGALSEGRDRVRTAFRDWMDECGGMAGHGCMVEVQQ